MVVAPAPARSVRILVLLAAAVLAFAVPLPSNANHVQGTTTGAPFTAPEWGKWVLGNVRIPAGSKVTFEANFDPGAASDGYVWPNATPTAGC